MRLSNKFGRKVNQKSSMLNKYEEWVSLTSYYIQKDFPILEYVQYQYYFMQGQLFIRFRGDR